MRLSLNLVITCLCISIECTCVYKDGTQAYSEPKTLASPWFNAQDVTCTNQAVAYNDISAGSATQMIVAKNFNFKAGQELKNATVNVTLFWNGFLSSSTNGHCVENNITVFFGSSNKTMNVSSLIYSQWTSVPTDRNLSISVLLKDVLDPGFGFGLSLMNTGSAAVTAYMGCMGAFMCIDDLPIQYTTTGNATTTIVPQTTSAIYATTYLYSPSTGSAYVAAPSSVSNIALGITIILLLVVLSFCVSFITIYGMMKKRRLNRNVSSEPIVLEQVELEDLPVEIIKEEKKEEEEETNIIDIREIKLLEDVRISEIMEVNGVTAHRIYVGTWNHVAVNCMRLNSADMTAIKHIIISFMGLKHENMMYMNGFFIDASKNWYLISETSYFPSVGKYIRDKRACEKNSKYQICMDVAKAMMYIHSTDFIIRNVNVEDIYQYEPSAKYKVAKLGCFSMLAKLDKYGVFQDKFELYDNKITSLCPEGMSVGLWSKASDIWSFGMFMFHVFSEGDKISSNNFEVDEKDAENNNADSTYEKKVPKNVLSLIVLCLDEDPEKRPSMEELEASLASHITSSDVIYAIDLQGTK